MASRSPILVFATLLALSNNALAAVPNGFLFPGSNPASGTLRLTLLGTGTPNVNKAQVSSSYLVELGDGQVFLFDAGSNSFQNLVATGVERGKVNKVFLTHLHSDHIADLAPLYAVGYRTKPLQIWGPTGQYPHLGLNATIEGLKAFLAWDQEARNYVGEYGTIGNPIIAHEFPYNKTNQLVYDEDGVKIYSNIAVHYSPGPVAYRLEWQGLKFTFSGDTVPLETFVEFAKGSDIVLHETRGPFLGLDGIQDWQRNIILNHTNNYEVGQIFEATQPRLAIATHLSVNPHTYIPIISAIRKSYPQGPLAIADDLQVFEVTNETVVQKTLYVPDRSAGWVFPKNSSISVPIGYELSDANNDLLPRTETVDSLGTVLKIFGASAGLAGTPAGQAVTPAGEAESPAGEAESPAAQNAG